MQDININYEHVDPNIILLELEEILNSPESIKLDHDQLSWYLENAVLKNKIVINHLINGNEIFKKIYDYHFVQKKNWFEKFESTIESIALCWLVHLYH
jgi:hypothetical protein